MSRPKNETYGGPDEPAQEPEIGEVEPIPGPDQGEQTPLVEPDSRQGTTGQGSDRTEVEANHDAHPIEAALEAADATVRKTQGGPPGSGIKALLAVVAAQIGVKLT